ncbi:hypothetical protein [Burkholderia contaminans]|uniref:Uncharacterized protein n=1 Tax=Burkholderia contaminans TaxID=488447 RepID=A0A3N8R6P7_9BURK|nr:hypothetical protein [Burkholderia contaminans]RQT27446.1 hypothetical protein DF037_18110 [Burkholderia contaminans]
MMEIVGDIVRPYAEFIVPASYNLQQTLEGLGAKVDIGHDAVIPGAAMYTILEPGIPIWLVVFCVALAMWGVMLLSMIASYCLGLKKGVSIGIGMWILPACLSILGLLPHYRGVPATFHLGSSGAIGTPWGMLPLVLLGLIAGWSLAVILVDLFSLGDRYQSYFDHLWVALAVLTGLFFVADSSNRQNERALSETTENVRLASNYLLAQVKRYDQAFCHNTSLPASSSCRWAADIQGTLVTYAYNEYRFFWTVGPDSATALYAPNVRQPSSESISRLRVELNEINRSLCGAGRQRQGDWCDITPANICNPDEQHRDYMMRPVAISSECIVPMLVHLKSKSEAEHIAAAEADTSQHWRHIYYMAFSVFAGVKIGNTTARLHAVGREPRLMQLLNRLVRMLFAGCTRFARLIVLLMRLVCERIADTAARAVRGFRQRASKKSKEDLPPRT